VTGGTPQMLASHIKAGKLVPLVYLDKGRSQEYPNVPTAIEEGFNFTCLQWRGIIAPKELPVRSSIGWVRLSRR